MPNHFKEEIALCNFKEWKKYEKLFGLIRWPVFLICYRRMLRRIKRIFLPKISVRYLHYYKYYISNRPVDPDIDEPYLLEEEIISDSEPDDEVDKPVLYWDPTEFNHTLPLHSDSDYPLPH